MKSIHDKIKDFKCDKCEYKTTTKHNLIHHIKSIHDNIKDFKCDKCEYKTTTKHNLKKHMKICTGAARK